MLIISFSFIVWILRQDRQDFCTVLERIDANTTRIADHTWHIAELAVKTLEVADKTLETASRNERLSLTILRKLGVEREA